MTNPVALSPTQQFFNGLLAVLAAVVGATIAARAGLYFEQVANYVEGIFWITAAAILLRRTCWRDGGRWGSRTRHRRLAIGAAITLVAFGISDFIEMRTGAWYDPPALFALKAACVVSLVVHFGLFARERSAADEDASTARSRARS